jgi:hypothetical protein
MNDGYNYLELWSRTSCCTHLTFLSVMDPLSCFDVPVVFPSCQVSGCDMVKFIPWIVVTGDLHGQEDKKVSEVQVIFFCLLLIDKVRTKDKTYI